VTDIELAPLEVPEPWPLATLWLPITRRITGSDSDGADAAQEALISVVRSIGRFDGRSRYSTWVYRIAVNASLDELRRRSRRPRPAEDWISAVPPGRDVEDAAQTVDVESALKALPVDFRAAVVLRDMCGLDYEEISAVLAIPPGTVRSRIARGRSALAELLAGARSEP
jgi:RNA polymerase sigma-70 factor (ECF subfamily)